MMMSVGFVILCRPESHRRLFERRFQAEGKPSDLRKFIDGPSSYLSLPPELKSAVEAITYIAEALQAEKDYEAVRFAPSTKNLFHCKRGPGRGLTIPL